MTSNTLSQSPVVVLTQQPHAGIPGTVVTAQKPAPVRHALERDPCGHAQRARQMRRRAIGSDHQIASLNHRSAVEKGIGALIEVVSFDRHAGRQMVELFRPLALLQADKPHIRKAPRSFPAPQPEKICLPALGSPPCPARRCQCENRDCPTGISSVPPDPARPQDNGLMPEPYRPAYRPQAECWPGECENRTGKAFGPSRSLRPQAWRSSTGSSTGQARKGQHARRAPARKRHSGRTVWHRPAPARHRQTGRAREYLRRRSRAAADRSALPSAAACACATRKAAGPAAKSCISR